MQQPVSDGRARETHRRIRAYRRDDIRAQLERRLIMLGIGFGPFAAAVSDEETRQRLARALRLERRASRAGGFGYDPLRHLVLVRLARALPGWPPDLDRVLGNCSRERVRGELAARRSRT